jgi:hypothetical protein
MNRLIQIVIAFVLIVLGALWSGQGAGYIPGSFMSGDRTWLVIGVILLLAGLVLLLRALLRRV